jgi:hypothetical protein
VLALLKVLAGLVVAVVQYLVGRKSTLPDPREVERVEKLEERLADDAKQRIRELDEKADRVRDRAAADELLRHVTGADDPTLN